jgi:hypothetical protein
MKCLENVVWWKHIPNLFCSDSILPRKNSSLASEINTVSRLIIIIFLIFSIFDLKYAFVFLVISNVFIILHYLQKNKEMSKNKDSYQQNRIVENYQYNDMRIKPPSKITSTKPVQICDINMTIDGPGGAINNPEWTSINQKLAGGPNPKTKIAPVLSARSHDLDYWRANNMVVHSAINDATNIDEYNSGYTISTSCPKPYECHLQHITNENNINKENFINTEQHHINNKEEEEIIEPLNKQIFSDNVGLVNLNCGYNPSENLKVNLPSNLIVGNCQKSEYMKNMNDNIFTQIIQPGVYTKTEVNQPINSNIGISFTQQIPPTTENIKNGETIYTEHDPLVFGNVPNRPSCVPENEVSEYNVYDPRFSGYGTSYRSFIEDTTGQPRFYYDDVDCIRMPNYVVRSHIDTLPFADQYGPIPEGDADGNKYTSNIRNMVHDAFTDSAILHRTDIQQSAMRKINAIKWQQKMAPVNKNQQRMLGGCGLK